MESHRQSRIDVEKSSHASDIWARGIKVNNEYEVLVLIPLQNSSFQGADITALLDRWTSIYKHIVYSF